MDVNRALSEPEVIPVHKDVNVPWHELKLMVVCPDGCCSRQADAEDLEMFGFVRNGPR